jgi:5'-nucleotidase
LWNINFPETAETPPKGVRLAGMGFRRLSDTVEKRLDPRGRPYYWSGIDPLKNHNLEAGTDVKELRERYITLTPLHFDLTDSQLMASLKGRRWE